MATLILFKKGLYAMLLMGVLPVLAQITQVTFGFLPNIVAVLFMLIIVSPELGLFFPAFRKWVQAALEDGDGVFNKQDLIDTFLIYAAILPVRAVAFGYLFMMIGGWNPSYDQLYGPLLATVASGLVKFAGNLKK